MRERPRPRLTTLMRALKAKRAWRFLRVWGIWGVWGVLGVLNKIKLPSLQGAIRVKAGLAIKAKAVAGPKAAIGVGSKNKGMLVKLFMLNKRGSGIREAPAAFVENMGGQKGLKALAKALAACFLALSCARFLKVFGQARKTRSKALYSVYFGWSGELTSEIGYAFFCTKVSRICKKKLQYVPAFCMDLCACF